jgi:hypothetical protein
MNVEWKNRLPVAIVAALAVAALVISTHSQPAFADRADSSFPGGRYSVVETEGHNLIVTDNKTNTLYFYTIDKDKEVGSELKMRGSVDLNQVGKETIQPTKAK